jgi:hypothetical protein
MKLDAYIRIRDEGVCVYCKSRIGQDVEHVLPVFLGGKTIKGNLVLSCRKCNMDKAFYLSLPHLLIGFKHLLSVGESLAWVDELPEVQGYSGFLWMIRNREIPVVERIETEDVETEPVPRYQPPVRKAPRPLEQRVQDAVKTAEKARKAAESASRRAEKLRKRLETYNRRKQHREDSIRSPLRSSRSNELRVGL